MSIFSPPEIARRWKAVRDRLGDTECAVVTSFYNSYYLSGLPMLQWSRFSITILFRDSDAPVLITPAFEATAVARTSPIADVRFYRDDDGPSLATATALAIAALKERRVATIGIEANGMPTAMYFQLASALPDKKFVDVTSTIDETRLVSSPEELTYSREASRIADLGMKKLIELLTPGVEETHVCAQARLAMDREVKPGFHVTTACYMQQGELTYEIHLPASRRPIEAGLIVEATVECEVWYYQASMERCILIGETLPGVERAYAVMLKAFHAARDAVRPGATMAEVDKAARRIFLDAGYDQIATGSGFVRTVVHHTGGRIDAGNLRSYNHRPLQPGMVLTIEPWAFVPGVGGPRHCDMVLVTNDGHEVLSTVDSSVLRVKAVRAATSP